MANGDTKETGDYPDIRRVIKQMQNSRVDVGYFPEQKSKENPKFNLASLAAVHEYGSPKRNIPQRSFLGANADKNKAKYTRLIKQQYEQVIALKKTPMQVLTAIGIMVQGDVQEYIVNLRTPPNKPDTIKRKGSSNPLIDTGFMKNSVKFKVKL